MELLTKIFIRLYISFASSVIGQCNEAFLLMCSLYFAIANTWCNKMLVDKTLADWWLQSKFCAIQYILYLAYDESDQQASRVHTYVRTYISYVTNLL